MVDTTVVNSSPSQSTNATGEGAPLGYSVVKLHTCIISLIGVLGLCLQLKFPNMSPYATIHGTHLMNLFIIVISNYILCLIVTAILADRNNAILEDPMNKISLLLGSLSLILELLVLLAPFGWIVLIFWSICLVCFVSKSYRSLRKLYQSAVRLLVQDFGELERKLVVLNRRLMDNVAIAAVARSSKKLKDLIIRNEEEMTEQEGHDQNHTNEADINFAEKGGKQLLFSFARPHVAQIAQYDLNGPYQSAQYKNTSPCNNLSSVGHQPTLRSAPNEGLDNEYPEFQTFRNNLVVIWII